MADRKHLRQHRGKWYLSARVPLDLLSHYNGRSHIVRSLDTDSLAVAQRRRDEAMVTLRQHWDRLRGAPVTNWHELTPTGAARLLRLEVEAGRTTVDDARAGILDRAYWDARDHDPAGLTLPPEYPPTARLLAIAEGRGGTLLSEAVQRHLAALAKTARPSTVYTRRRALEALVGALDDPLLPDITRAMLADHVGALEGAAGTRRNVATGITAFFHWAQDHGLIDSTPADRLTRIVRESSRGTEDGQRRPWTDTEVADLWARVDALKPRDYMRLLIPVALYSGMRLDEICELTDSDIVDGFFHIRKGKNANAIRRVPIHSRLLPLVEGVNGYLIRGLTPTGLDAKRSQAASKRFGKLKRGKWGYGPELVFHGLRASFMQKLRDAGIVEHHIAAIVGHASQGETFKTYAKTVADNVMREAIEKVSYANVP